MDVMSDFAKWLKTEKYICQCSGEIESLWMDVVTVRALGELAEKQRSKFRLLAQECFDFIENNSGTISNLEKTMMFNYEEYFDGVADVWEEICEGKCKQLEERLKEVERRLSEAGKE